MSGFWCYTKTESRGTKWNTNGEKKQRSLSSEANAEHPQVPGQSYIVIDGKGDPNQRQDFSEHVGAFICLSLCD